MQERDMRERTIVLWARWVLGGRSCTVHDSCRGGRCRWSSVSAIITVVTNFQAMLSLLCNYICMYSVSNLQNPVCLRTYYYISNTMGRNRIDRKICITRHNFSMYNLGGTRRCSIWSEEQEQERNYELLHSLLEIHHSKGYNQLKGME